MDTERLVLVLAGVMGAAQVGLFAYFIGRRLVAVAAWKRTVEGKRLAHAHANWLLAKARLETVEQAPIAPVTRAYYVMRGGAPKNHQRLVRELRHFVRMRVRLLPIGGGEVATEQTLSIPASEMGDLAPGAIFSVLYDPRDPRSFCIDSLRRDAELIDGATLRTRAAEENFRAQLAFSQGPQGSHGTQGSRQY